MIYFISFTLWALSIWISNPALALFLGIFLAFLFKLPEDYFTRQYGSRILQTGIVFLGGSISIGSIYEINSDYFFWISIFVLFSFGAVLILGRLLGVSKRFSFNSASLVSGSRRPESFFSSLIIAPSMIIFNMLKMDHLAFIFSGKQKRRCVY